MAMFKDPHFGYGKNVNPVHRLQDTQAQEGSSHHGTGKALSFIATGEVLGQRPMSQHKNSLNAIEKRSGLRGLFTEAALGKTPEPDNSRRKRLGAA